MEVTATAKNVRISPEKVRLVVAQIKKLPPKEAVEILNYVSKRSSLPLKKVIASAIANAKNNFDLTENSLTFREISVTKGIVFKRFKAVARGRAHPILKRTSHIKVVLEGEQRKEVSKVPEVPEASRGSVSKVSKESKATK
ncbi:MAG: 50S ribosomal protein L22 [Candidatus Curtissbacteria bacterium GW2011_GWA1_40_47]|uniref:Large ribosomal subunit protein uL22 n=1 Tax=Candidatus Curtissbacteria bacterium RIFOXYA1_FULL_41_14 TaxID=1797737 RepID=A0A1F5HCF1_9BACT|nr:MAG: 50S ribosomal protein L22 [Candidatus Curtissbacteria bacterium GW2011_GWB1_40_28]KKR61214.1 MAG: 50S ribosomal protein L22 [Candidatus Curtissbacteria bacterium GW2011_GWA2_40_31]KKR62201.1 MAG: 50S ribosomal protein L22 [Microgenomates group bacterium GW2011_GWC1_40_35]KKR66220.1 MAG: 50S ribosomal protein L22 [Candidatus Curtissbacteria bacterium GW2011_GWA1_40_47]KKR75855.1 MAG: 50S ribosomal protein L22 [Candidatus Curtissbacteria bacterium GW2011_GWD1_40_8]KKS02319.1 MAG: 50S rib